jgi:aryl-alcohol dehydrogenase-like predicted oxidoreductase
MVEPTRIRELAHWTVAVPVAAVVVLVLTWGRDLPGVVVAIVAAVLAAHLDDAIAAVELELTDNELERLSASYSPRAIAGH